MAATTLTTVRGELQLVIAGGDPISIGRIDIPIEVATHTDTHGNLLIRTATPIHEVREFVEQVFQRPAEGAAEVKP